MAIKSHERSRRTVFDLLDGRTRDTLWLAIAVASVALVYGGYVLTHPYPAYGGGLFLQTAETIAEHSYGLPQVIPGYTPEGIPFGYPPLMFYVTAIAIDGLGIDPLAMARYFPGLVVMASLFPFYGIARELTENRNQAGLATVLFGVTPTVLRWHLSAGGLVRAPAMLFALIAVFGGVKLFSTHERRWLAVSILSFGATVLTHPTYTSFVVVSFLLLYGGLDRTPTGLVYGAIAGLGGAMLAAPWWLQVLTTHGASIFTSAAGTHGGLGGGIERFVVTLTYPLDNFDAEWPFFVAAYLGAGYSLLTRRYILPVWAISATYLVGKGRFFFVAGSVLTAVLVYEVLVGGMPNRFRSRSVPDAVPTAVVILTITTAVLVGVLFGAGLTSAANGSSPSQPAFIDAHDQEAMRWMKGNTDPTATFVVLGDSAEWVPYVTDRTISLGPWGVEWVSPTAYRAHLDLFKTTSTCPDAGCIQRKLDHSNIDPDFLYVPKGEFTVRGNAITQAPGMRSSLDRSDRLVVVFENEDVVIAQVLEEPIASPDFDPERR